MPYRTNEPEAENVAIVVVYDSTSGDILHWHHFSADDASELPSHQALEREAIEHATHHASEEMRKALAEASFLHLDRQTLESQGPVKVDTKKRVLVKLEPE
jgi:DNA-binding IscR family transcriptional regulator